MPGDLLASLLLQQGLASAARLDARVGRSAYNFWRREKATSLLQSDLAWGPTIAIVFLGTNDIGLNMAVDQKSMDNVRQWLASGGAEVWAIGPPSFANVDRQKGTSAVVAMMRRVFGVRFLDARPLTADLTRQGRASDLIHFNAQGSKVFADRLANAFLNARRWYLVRQLGTVAVTMAAPLVAYAWQSRP
jgi:lysophospholipase L1-like esterase